MSQDDGDGFDPYEDAPEWTDEDEERYQARRQEDARRRRRRRRQGASFTALVLVVLGAGVLGAGVNQGWWDWPFGQEDEAPTAQCPEGDASISPAGQVQVRVLNGTAIRGLAGTVGTEMRNRGYDVAGVGNDEGDVEVVDGAQIRYGPELLADAQSVAVNFRGVVLVDDGRTGDVVDVVLGTGYRRMVPVEEATASIAAAAPAPPPGCAPATTPAPTTTG